MQILLIHLVPKLILQECYVSLLRVYSLLRLIEILKVHLDLAVLLREILLQSLHLLALVVDLNLLDLQCIVFLVDLLLQLVHLLLHDEDFHRLRIR
jgi:hypothetical protein